MSYQNVLQGESTSVYGRGMGHTDLILQGEGLRVLGYMTEKRVLVCWASVRTSTNGDNSPMTKL